MKTLLGVHSFVIGMVLVFALAAVAPEWGNPDGAMPINLLGLIGVFLIFFNQGVSLPGEEMRRGILEWKLHLLVQITTYLIFPLLAGLGLWLGSAWFDQPDLRRGFLYLAFVPTTVASAVALTSLARGNVSGALFNCTLSSVIGVFLVPVLCVVFLDAGGVDGRIALGGMLGKIALTILFPLVLGQVLRRWLKDAYARHKTAVRRFNSGVILFIVWSAFCQSFLSEVWSQVGWLDLTLTGIGAIALLAASGAWLWWGSARLGLGRESRVAAFYSGGQKSVAMGLPLSAMIFGVGAEGADLGLLLLPLLVYHTAQLMLGGWLVPRFQRGLPMCDPSSNSTSS